MLLCIQLILSGRLSAAGGFVVEIGLGMLAVLTCRLLYKHDC